MSASIKDLESELKALKTQRDTVDVATLQAALEAATQAIAVHQANDQKHGLIADPREGELRREQTEAKQALDRAKDKLRDLDRRIQPLEGMTTGAKRAAAAMVDLSGLQAQLDTAQAAHAAASETVALLHSRLADETAEHAATREHAAAAILEAAKSGKALAPAHTDNSALLALESALEMAQAEEGAAAQAAASIQAQIADNQRQLADAQKDAAELIFEIATRDFEQALQTYRATAGDFMMPLLLDRIATS